VFQLNNEFPTRTIKKPNLIKSRYFRSAKGTPDQSFEKNNQNDPFDDFDISDVLDAKNKKKHRTRKVEAQHEQVKNFNPFKSKGNEKKQKQRIESHLRQEYDEDSDEEEMVQNMEVREKNESEQKVVKAKGNYVENENVQRTSISNKNNGNANNTNSTVNAVVEVPVRSNETTGKNKIPREGGNVSENIRVEEKMFQNTIKEEVFEKENAEKGCPVCMSASAINSKVRLRSGKKINPCLVEPQDIKHTIICCSHQSTQGHSVQELDPRNYKMLPPCLLNIIPAAGKANKMSDPVSNLFK